MMAVPHCVSHVSLARCPHQTLADAVELMCERPTCAWNGARDYAAALNIARLGVAFLRHYQATKQYSSFSMASPSVQPCCSTRQGASLRLSTQRVLPVPSGKTRTHCL